MCISNNRDKKGIRTQWSESIEGHQLISKFKYNHPLPIIGSLLTPTPHTTTPSRVFFFYLHVGVYEVQVKY